MGDARKRWVVPILVCLGLLSLPIMAQVQLGVEQLPSATSGVTPPYEITTDGQGSCTYPVRVSPGEMIDALITVNYEFAPHEINEGYPPEVTILVADEMGSGFTDNPVDWESYSAELDDQRRVHLKLKMPEGGDIVLKMMVTHFRTWVIATPGNLATSTASNRQTTIQLTVRGTEYDIP